MTPKEKRDRLVGAARRKKVEAEKEMRRGAAIEKFCSDPGCTSEADELGHGRCFFHWFWGSGF